MLIPRGTVKVHKVTTSSPSDKGTRISELIMAWAFALTLGIIAFSSQPKARGRSYDTRYWVPLSLHTQIISTLYPYAVRLVAV